MSFTVEHTLGSLGLSCYPSDPQDFAAALVAALASELDATFTGLVSSPTEPDVDDRDKIWFNTTDGFVYHYYEGAWMRRHSLPSSGSARILWTGTEEELWAYDGGDGTDPSVSAPTETTGAVWQVDTTFAGKFVVGPGTLNPSGTVIAVGATGGADEVELEEAQLPEHFHYVASDDTTGVSPVTESQAVTLAGEDSGGASSRAYTLTGKAAADDPAVVGRSSLTGDGDPVPTVPPYRVAYVAKRTARKWVLAS